MKKYKRLEEQAKGMFEALGYTLQHQNDKYIKYTKPIESKMTYFDFNYTLEIVLINFDKQSYSCTRYYETMGISKDVKITPELQKAIDKQIDAHIAKVKAGVHEKIDIWEDDIQCVY